MNKRFYPDYVERFEYEPDRNHFRIIGDEIKGEGIITLVPFKKNEIVFRFTGEILPYQTLFTLQVRRGAYVHDPHFMGKLLHSCEPNLICNMSTFTFTSTREILPNEYLSMDYESTEEELFREFVCQCGSPNCRGLIRGWGLHPEYKPTGIEVQYTAV